MRWRADIGIQPGMAYIWLGLKAMDIIEVGLLVSDLDSTKAIVLRYSLNPGWGSATLA